MLLLSFATTLLALLVAFATPATAGSADPDLPQYDNLRGSGLPHCECDAYHNGAFQWMSRMCEQPFEEGERVVCYPTRVGHPGTVLNNRFYDNNCNHGQTMCSPWTQPEPEPEPGSQIQFGMPISIGTDTNTATAPYWLNNFEGSLGALKDDLAGLYGGLVSADMIQIAVTNVVDTQVGFGASAILLVTITAPDEPVQVVVNAIIAADYTLLSTNSAITATIPQGGVERFALNGPIFGITVAGEPLLRR